MPTIFTFFDNSSATSLPVSPTHSLTPKISRWSASTTTSVATCESRRVSQLDNRFSTLSTSTNMTSDSRSTMFPLSPLSKQSESFFPSNGFYQFSGERDFFGRKTSEASTFDDDTITTGSTYSGEEGEGTNLSPWSSINDDHEPTPRQPVWITPNLPSTPNMDPLHSQPTKTWHRSQASSPLPERCNTSTIRHARIFSELDVPELRQRANSAPSPMTESQQQQEADEDYFSFQPSSSPDQRKACDAPITKSGHQGSKKLFKNLKGLFGRHHSEGDVANDVSVGTSQT